MGEPGAAERIGVFGGAFDPPHWAHVALARAALEQLDLDRLYVFPTGHAWHKARVLAPAEHRWRMAEAAFGGLPRTQVDAEELQRSGPSYTIDTLEALQRRHPGGRIFLIIGSDQLEQLPTWHRWRELLDRCTLAVAQRGASSSQALAQRLAEAAGLPAEGLAQRIHILRLPDMPWSSTEVRRRIRQGEPILELVPPAVAGYIERHRLYGNS